MIYIEFDDESNVPEDTVRREAHRAEEYDAKLRRIHGVSSKRVAAHASAAAGMIAGRASRFSRISGRFGRTAIEATPMRADYAAAMNERGGMRPRDLPWLACEKAIRGDYDVYQRRVGFQLTFAMKIPPASVTLDLFQHEDDSLNPNVPDATFRCGVAEVPFPLHLPAGMRGDDLASAIELLMPVIQKSAVDLWMQSEGGTREVF